MVTSKLKNQYFLNFFPHTRCFENYQLFFKLNVGYILLLGELYLRVSYFKDLMPMMEFILILTTQLT